ncbi:ComEC/Rec2 family competence protein [Candidatus Microgenomates bacterium]|nr:MAG: ComEC/Rec2 family competence protein [Candidatus Microgenomates bacterium]
MSQPKIILIAVILLFFLSFRFYFFYHNISNLYNGQSLSLETTLLQEPKISGGYQRFSVNQENGEQIFIITPKYPSFGYGDSVRITGKIEERALNSKKVIMTMFLPKIEAVNSNSNFTVNPLNSVLAVITNIRQNIIQIMAKTLPPLYSSLLLGIVFGIKEGMPKEFMDNLRLSGVLHVIAASGMNVTMTAGFLSAIFSVIFKRQIAILVSIVGIIFYAVVSGLEPSIVRASIMGIIVFTAQMLGRQNLAVFSLFTAGFLMLFISPSLLFNVGFQLSFVSTLGLLYIRPLFERKKRMKVLLKKSLVGEDITTTISAQAATLPILLVNFGSYSFFSIIVNALVLWTIPFLMIFGGVGVILGVVFQPLGKFVIYLTLPLLLYFEKIINFFASLGGAVDFGQIAWPFWIAYYCLLVGLIIFFGERKKKEIYESH